MVVDADTGLMIPKTFQSHRYAGIFTKDNSSLANPVDGRGFGRGLKLERDANSLIPRWPGKGTGYDDLVCEAVVDGKIANVGLSPVVAPQISAMVKRQQLQAANATIALSGRAAPVTRASDAIARFNDSPMGATAALKKIVYNICVYNKGAPIATVPITYAVDKWGDYGLEAVPLAGPRGGKTPLCYLKVDWEKHGTPVPFLPSVFDLEPSGIEDWPYWYRASVDGQQRYQWILLHKTHIIALHGAESGTAGIGTSPVWMCLGYLAEEILVLEARAEQAAYSLTDGITLLGGVEAMSGEEILENLEESRAEAMARGFIAAKGQTILTSPLAEKVSIAQVNFRQNLTDFNQWRQSNEDIITFCFGETLTAMVMRGGVGYGAQADTGADNNADSGVGAILYLMSMALGAIYPRVAVSISRPNDRAQRLNIKTLVDFAGAAHTMIDDGVMTADEARAITDRDILDIPVLSTDTITVTPNSDDPSISDTSQNSQDAQRQRQQKANQQKSSQPQQTNKAAGAQPAPVTKKTAAREQRPWHPDMDFDGAVSRDEVDVIYHEGLQQLKAAVEAQDNYYKAVADDPWVFSDEEMSQMAETMERFGYIKPLDDKEMEYFKDRQDYVGEEIARRAQLATRYRNGQVVITDSDGDRAVKTADERIGTELAGLLVAEKE